MSVPSKSKDAEALLDLFAVQSFRDMADRDYVSARSSYQLRLVPQFLWSALHCLEKYVKCGLLFRRIDSRPYGHEVKRPLEKLESSLPEPLRFPVGVTSFLDRLESCAQYRYLEVSYFNMPHDILPLDRAVVELRKFCKPLSEQLRPDEPLNPRAEEAAPRPLRKMEPIPGGWLEQILEDRKHPARKALVWNNLYVGPSTRKSVRLVPYFEARNSPLFLNPEILDDVSELVRIPKAVVDAWRFELRKIVE